MILLNVQFTLSKIL